MKKKWKLLILSALCISCFSFAVACKQKENENETVKFPEFIDETVDIELGEIVSVHDFLKVYDEENNLYSATFTLTDSAGNSVTLLKNEFTVEDSEGYTLELNLRDPKTGDIIATRTVQFRTVDKSAPLITIGDFAEYGVIGESFTVPLVFTDTSGNFNTSVTVMRLPYRTAANGYDESIAEPVDAQHASKSNEATFTPTTKGRHKVLVEAWDGTDKEQAKNASLYNSKVAYVDIKGSDMEIEGFDLPESTAAVYGATNTGTAEEPKYAGSKTVSANNAKWHDVFESKEGVVSMTSAHPSAYGNVYYIGSVSRTSSFHNPGESYAIGIDWDYVSMWIYIAGEDGQSVKVSGSYDFDEREVPFNTWYEYRVYKAYFVKTNWNRPSYTLSTATNATWSNRSMLYVGEKNDTKDYTVYVDSLTYVNAEDAMDIQATASTTQGTAGTVSFTITPKAGYETTLANAQYTAYLHMFAGTDSKGESVYKNNAYTYQTSTTHVWIVVRVEIDGVSYVSDVMYEIPTVTA